MSWQIKEKDLKMLEAIRLQIVRHNGYIDWEHFLKDSQEWAYRDYSVGNTYKTKQIAETEAIHIRIIEEYDKYRYEIIHKYLALKLEENERLRKALEEARQHSSE